MSVDGIQICVDGVACADVLTSSTNPKIKTIFFIVSSLTPQMG